MSIEIHKLRKSRKLTITQYSSKNWYAVHTIESVDFTNASPEYHYKTITKLFGGNALYGCYALAVTIFSLGIIRDAM